MSQGLQVYWYIDRFEKDTIENTKKKMIKETKEHDLSGAYSLQDEQDLNAIKDNMASWESLQESNILESRSEKPPLALEPPQPALEDAKVKKAPKGKGKKGKSDPGAEAVTGKGMSDPGDVAVEGKKRKCAPLPPFNKVAKVGKGGRGKRRGKKGGAKDGQVKNEPNSSADSDSDDEDSSESEGAPRAGQAQGSGSQGGGAPASALLSSGEIKAEVVVPPKKKGASKGGKKTGASIVQKLLNKLINITHDCNRLSGQLTGKLDIARKSEMSRLGSLAEQACHAGLEITDETHIAQWETETNHLIAEASAQIKINRKLVGKGSA
jgi:hypothetical protein